MPLRSWQDLLLPRILRNRVMTSVVWDNVTFRNDDVIFGTRMRSGTTRMQQIVAHLAPPLCQNLIYGQAMDSAHVSGRPD